MSNGQSNDSSRRDKSHPSSQPQALIAGISGYMDPSSHIWQVPKSQDLLHLGPKNLIGSGPVVPICNMAFAVDNYRRTETVHPKLLY